MEALSGNCIQNQKTFRSVMQQKSPGKKVIAMTVYMCLVVNHTLECNIHVFIVITHIQHDNNLLGNYTDRYC